MRTLNISITAILLILASSAGLAQMPASKISPQRAMPEHCQFGIR